MNAINNWVNKTGEQISYSIGVAAYALTHNEPLERTAKILERVIDIAEIALGGLSKGLANFNEQVKDSIVVLSSLRFFGVLQLLACPNEKGKYFLTDPNNSWQKRVDRVNLLFHTALKTYKGMNKFGFVSLGVMAKDAIGKLPIFTLVMDGFMLVSSFFSTWDSCGVLLPRALEGLENADKKISKWECRQTEIEYLKANFEKEGARFQSRYQDKAVELNARLEKFEREARFNEEILLKATGLPITEQGKTITKYTAEKTKLDKEIKKVHAKQLQNDDRLAKIAAGNFRGLAEDLGKKDAKGMTKSERKLKRYEVEKANFQTKKSESWIKIANSVCKFAVIVLALTLVAINSWTLPETLALLAMGIVAESIGLTKNLVEVFWKAKKIPSDAPAAAPALAAAARA